ncbi:hypothetical protein [Psychroflexus montanilacus]|uniref:hypothetical protein n=1 Tax=Psychroflexus montanilacus TaxID=2873598 RepID=UPI001CCB5ACF|nr:hypothetical protein [Psychroflexus montanilacus]MBZ9650678.1 hypothetical protein [Psychroflexus montanilacus]
MNAKFNIPVLIILLIFVSSCATKVDFPVSKTVPEANVTAKVKKDGNDNYKIDLKAEDLTSPERLDPSREMYVVWIETARGTKNIGKLNISSGMFSSKRKGSLSTTTAFKPSRIIITAENTSTNNEPGTFIIVSSENF